MKLQKQAVIHNVKITDFYSQAPNSLEIQPNSTQNRKSSERRLGVNSRKNVPSFENKSCF